MAAYSFLDVSGTVIGPGGAGIFGSGAGAAEEGITITPAEDKNVMQIGADGNGQHSLIASDAGKVTFRLLKTSPLNAVFMAMYDLQSAASSLWGTNTIAVVVTSTGDLHTCQLCAFNKKPEINYQKEAGMNEWVFDSIKITTILGATLNG